jgi:hypothetical protein
LPSRAGAQQSDQLSHQCGTAAAVPLSGARAPADSCAAASWLDSAWQRARLRSSSSHSRCSSPAAGGRAPPWLSRQRRCKRGTQRQGPGTQVQQPQAWHAPRDRSQEAGVRPPHRRPARQQDSPAAGRRQLPWRPLQPPWRPAARPAAGPPPCRPSGGSPPLRPACGREAAARASARALRGRPARGQVAAASKGGLGGAGGPWRRRCLGAMLAGRAPALQPLRLPLRPPRPRVAAAVLVLEAPDDALRRPQRVLGLRLAARSMRSGPAVAQQATCGGSAAGRWQGQGPSEWGRARQGRVSPGRGHPP